MSGSQHPFDRKTFLCSIKPILRAYGLGHATSTGPRLFKFVATTLQRKDLSVKAKWQILCAILRHSIQPNRFPAAAAVIVGGATTLPKLGTALLQWLLCIVNARRQELGSRVSRGVELICSFACAWLAFDLLNHDPTWAQRRVHSRSANTLSSSESTPPNQHHLPPPNYHPEFAGKTMDLTLFALYRAIDVAVVSAWTKSCSASRHPERRFSKFAKIASKMVDPLIFASAAGIVMWAWFYAPHRLPRAYNHWISSVADLDPCLLHALRLCRQGDFVYGQDTGQSQVLEPLCKKLGLPAEYADPAVTVPIPCELYHSGTGKSCEFHGLSRLLRAWKLSMKIYLPLQLLSVFRSPTVSSVVDAIKSAARSSSFLAGFVGTFYYAVCLARTRLGPKIFPHNVVTPQMLDGGLSVLTGCLFCGFSILLERKPRRQEITLFVAPRALAALFPRVYLKEYMTREQMTFAASIAIVLTTVRAGHEKSVRGVLGKILGRIMRES